MKIHEYSRTQVIQRKRSDVFAFFENPSNLSRITPPQMGFQILTPLPIQMEKGLLIDYAVKILALPMRWTSLITEYDPPRKFVDVQIKGPYSFWHHTHLFRETPDGTAIEDRVTYQLPFSSFAQYLEPFLVRPQLKKIFDYREKVIADVFDLRPEERG